MSIFTGLHPAEVDTTAATPTVNNRTGSHVASGIGINGACDSVNLRRLNREHALAQATTRTASRPRVPEAEILNRIDGVLHHVLDDIRRGALPRVGFEMEDALNFHRAQAGQIQMSATDSRPCDRLYRSLVVMDSVQVRPCSRAPVQACVRTTRSWSWKTQTQDNLTEDSSQTQRDLYYQVKSDLFPSQVAVAHGAYHRKPCKGMSTSQHCRPLQHPQGIPRLSISYSNRRCFQRIGGS
jgi:hypothetical protein